MFCCSAWGSSPLFFPVSVSVSLSPSPQASCVPGGGPCIEESIFCFVSSQFPETAPGLDAVGISSWMLEPSEAGTQPPEDLTVAAHSLASSSDIYGFRQCAWSCANQSTALWTWSPSTSSCSCCPSLGHGHLSLGACSSVQLLPFGHSSPLQPKRAF